MISPSTAPLRTASSTTATSTTAPLSDNFDKIRRLRSSLRSPSTTGGYHAFKDVLTSTNIELLELLVKSVPSTAPRVSLPISEDSLIIKDLLGGYFDSYTAGDSLKHLITALKTQPMAISRLLLTNETLDGWYEARCAKPNIHFNRDQIMHILLHAFLTDPATWTGTYHKILFSMSERSDLSAARLWSFQTALSNTLLISLLIRNPSCRVILTDILSLLDYSQFFNNNLLSKILKNSSPKTRFLFLCAILEDPSAVFLINSAFDLEALLSIEQLTLAERNLILKAFDTRLSTLIMDNISLSGLFKLPTKQLTTKHRNIIWSAFKSKLHTSTVSAFALDTLLGLSTEQFTLEQREQILLVIDEGRVDNLSKVLVAAEKNPDKYGNLIQKKLTYLREQKIAMGDAFDIAPEKAKFCLCLLELLISHKDLGNVEDEDIVLLQSIPAVKALALKERSMLMQHPGSLGLFGASGQAAGTSAVAGAGAGAGGPAAPKY